MNSIMAEVESERNAFELDPEMREFLVGMELTDEQIELVVGLAQRVLAASERGNVRTDWNAIKQRIEGVVERLPARVSERPALSYTWTRNGLRMTSCLSR